MKCPKCGAEYGTLVCPACARRRSRDGYLKLQEQYLPAVFAGAPLNLSRRNRSSPFHVALFGDPTHAFCNADLGGPQLRERDEYSSDLRQRLCVDCLAVFDEIGVSPVVPVMPIAIPDPGTGAPTS
jgi:hypothetical protein